LTTEGKTNEDVILEVSTGFPRSRTMRCANAGCIGGGSALRMEIAEYEASTCDG
jgi:hypothetical protein